MENNIRIQLPISITYAALEGALKKKLVGDYIPPDAERAADEPPYGQILDVSIMPSKIAGFNVFVALTIKVLRTILKRDSVDLYIPVALAYDNATQQLYVNNYQVDVKSGSSFYNGSLEFLANNVARNQILKKTRFNLKNILAREQKKVNGMLEKGLNAKGALVTGAIEEVLVQNIVAGPEGVTLLFMLQANAAVEITDLISLMPPEA